MLSVQTSGRLINRYTIALALVLLLNAVLKWRFFNGLVMADDYSYGVYAYRLFRVPLPWDMSLDFRMLRLSLLLPVSFVFAFLRPTELTAVLYPLGLSFGMVYLVYVIGKRLYGPAAGVWAAFVIATFPADVLYGTMLLPDIMAPFYCALGVWAFLRAETAGMDRSRKLWYAVSGFMVFLAFIARENSYYFLLFFIPFMFSARRWRNGLYLIGVGFAVPVFLLYIFYYVRSGDFLFNLHLAEHYRDPLIKSGYIPKNSENWYVMFYYMFPFFFKASHGKMFFFSELFGLAFFLGVPGLIYMLVKGYRKKNAMYYMPVWWFLLCYLFLEFGTISFQQYQMMKKLPRFLLMVSPALALGLGVVMADLHGDVLKKIKKVKKLTIGIIPGAVLLGVLIILSLFSLFGVVVPTHRSMKENVAQFRWAYYEVLKDKPRKPIYLTGGWWLNKLSFFMLPDLRYADVSWDRSVFFRELMGVKEPGELSGSYLVLDRSHFNGDNDLRVRHSYDSFGSYIQLPPPEWKLLGRKDYVEIYEIPESWVYHEPEGKALALGAFDHALVIKDVMLAFYSLHPDFVTSMTRDQFWTFIGALMDLTPEQRRAYYEQHVQYGESKGKWKLLFNFDKG